MQGALPPFGSVCCGHSAAHFLVHSYFIKYLTHTIGFSCQSIPILTNGIQNAQHVHICAVAGQAVAAASTTTRTASAATTTRATTGVLEVEQEEAA